MGFQFRQETAVMRRLNALHVNKALSNMLKTCVAGNAP
jgi:hypothetical protein